jgi:hypothetical protein
MVLMPIDALKTTMQTEGNERAIGVLKERIKLYGPGTLWAGAFATAAANFVGSFPWYTHLLFPAVSLSLFPRSDYLGLTTFWGFESRFATYNYLSIHLPSPAEDHHHSHFGFVAIKLSRQALIGFVSSVVSDTISNSLRVVKTYRQTSETDVGYRKPSLSLPFLFLPLDEKVTDQAVWVFVGQATREILKKEGWRGLFGRGLKTRLLANGLQGIIFSVLWKVFQDLIERN